MLRMCKKKLPKDISIRQKILELEHLKRTYVTCATGHSGTDSPRDPRS